MNNRVPKVLLAVADGVEEIETVTVLDVLRRAGAEVVVATVAATSVTVGDKNLQIATTHGLKLIADKNIRDCVDEDFALIVLPGGMPGAENLRNSKELVAMLQRQKKAGRWFAAICAAPVTVLHHHGLLDGGVKATCYPSMVKKLGLTSKETLAIVQQEVVVDVEHHCVTSQGPGTAMAFALKLVELLFDQAKAQQLAGLMLV